MSIFQIIIFLSLIILWILIRYYFLYKKLMKYELEITSLKNKCSQLEKKVREEANKNIILQSVINQKNK